jgi:hypothetical protein
VSIAFSSKFLISLIIGGLILTVLSMGLILIIDILTLVITVMAIFFVRKSLSVKSQVKKKLDFFKDLKEGWMIILEFGATTSISVIIMSGFYSFIFCFAAICDCLYYRKEKKSVCSQSNHFNDENFRRKGV